MNRDKITVIYGRDAVAMGRELIEKSGAAAIFKRGMAVGVKPNLVVAKSADSGATSHVGFAEAVFQVAKDAGVSDLRVIEGAWVGAGTNFQIEGYDRLAKRYGAKLIDTKRDAAVKKTFAGKTALVCQSALDVDALINLPVLKAHCQTRLTCAIKNLKGCIPDSEKRRYHAEGLFEPIAMLPGLVPTAFTIVDGICGDLTFEEGGTPVPMHRAFLAFDPVKTDAYAANLLGLALDEVPYIGLSEKLGLGESSFSAEDILSLNEPRETRDLADLSGFSRVKKLTGNVREKGACSACYGSLVHALNQTGAKQAISIGQGFRGETGKGLGIGNCCAGFETCAKGCPPSAKDIVAAINNA